jgi:ADYC domain
MTQRTRTILCGIAVGAASVLANASRAHAGFCLSWGCGSNSATVGDGIVFDELNTKGQARDPLKNVRILWAEVITPLGWKPVHLQIKGHVLTAVDVDSPSTVYRGHDLQDMTFGIGHPDGRRYDVKIVRVCEPEDQPLHKKDSQPTKEGSRAAVPSARELAAKEPAAKYREETQPAGKYRDEPRGCEPLYYWVDPYDRIPYYELKVKKTALRDQKTKAAKLEEKEWLLKLEAAKKANRKPPERVSDDRPVDPDFKEHICMGEELQKDTFWRPVRHAGIFYEGDHFDPDKKMVSETVLKDGWFNLACAGAVPAKMHLLRHTKAGSNSGAGKTTSTKQRTAMLKMMTADYCGNGKAYTADNTPLRYKDAREWYTYTDDPFVPGNPATYGKIEAVWGPDGALCLNDPRRTPTTVTGACTHPAVTRAEVDADCTGHTYASNPPWAPGGSGPTVTRIPQCTPAWAAGWNPNAKPLASRIYVITATPKKSSPGEGDYCDPATGAPPF